MRTRRSLLLAGAMLVAFAALAAWWFFARGDRGDIDVASKPPVDASATQTHITALPMEIKDARTQSVAAEETAKNAQGAAFRNIRLLITDQDMNPLEGVRVESIAGAVPGVMFTDALGECRLQADRNVQALRLDISREGYVHLRHDWSNWPELTQQLWRTITLSGRILDAETRAPIPDARVVILEDYCKDCEPVFAVADSDGSYTLPGVLYDKARIRIEARGYPTLSGTFQFDAIGDSEHRDFLLPRGVALHGRVVDFVSGVAIAGATVRGGDSELVTDAGGAFDGRFVPDVQGNLELKVDAKTRCALILTLTREAIASGNELELRVPESPIVEGFVRDSAGKPVASAYVLVNDDPFARSKAKATATTSPATLLSKIPTNWKFQDADLAVSITDDKGAFRIVGLVPWGQFRTIRQDAKGFQRKVTNLDQLPGPSELLHLDLLIEKTPAEPGAVVFGKVWMNGVPVNCVVSWSAESKKGEATLDSGADYRFEKFPAGKVDLHVRAPGISARIEGDTVSLELHEGETLRHDFELNAPTATIRGQVHFVGGDPAAGAHVRSNVQRTRFERMSWVSTGHEALSAVDGSFSIDVPPYEDALRVTARLGATEVFRDDVHVGADDVRLELEASGKLLFRAMDARTREPIAMKLLTWQSRSAGEERFSELDQLPPNGDENGWVSAEFREGSLELMVRGKRSNYSSALTEIRIARSQESRIELLLEPGLHVQFRLDPPPDATWKGRGFYVVEPENWAGVRKWTKNGGNYFDGGAAFPGFTIYDRQLDFSADGTANLNCLGSGKYRFKVTPDDFPIDPPSIELTADTTEPIVLHWKR